MTVLTLLEDPVIKELASKYKKTAAQVILNWHLSRGYVVIPKTSTPERLKENLECDNFEMSVEDLKRISSLNRDCRTIDPRKLDNFGNIPVFH